jgi:hypothetical protein
MFRKLLTRSLSFALLALLAGPALFAQSTLDTGSLRGKVLDAKGRTLPGAIIRAKGPQGIKAAETDSQGVYNLPFLTPGTYDVTVTMDGFSTQVQSGVAVQAQQITGQSFKLSEGSDTIIVKAGANVDTSSSTSNTKINLTDAVQAFAQDRSFTAAFDFSPGAIANSGVGGGNYSIGGASGLENQYFIGGVNITNSGYGAIGAYDVVRGATGTGVTTEFLENLDIRDGGFEAEYGGALGGVISATVKTGTNDFHGEVFAYYAPSTLRSTSNTYVHPGGSIWSPTDNHFFEGGFAVGGPIIKDKLFFYVGYDPIWDSTYSRFIIDPADIAKDQVVLPFANVDYLNRSSSRVDNWTAHLTWNINEKHKLDFVAFGSPQSNDGLERSPGFRLSPTNDSGIPVNPPTAGGVADIQPLDGVQGHYRDKDFSASLKYFGSITHWLNVEAQLSFHRNQLSESPTTGSDQLRYNDVRRTQVFNAQTLGAGPGVPLPVVSPGTYTFGGLGAYQGGSNDENIDYLLKVTHNFHLGGDHELKWGVNYTHLKFHENLVYSGPQPEVFLVNGFSPGTGTPDSYGILRTGASPSVRCIAVDPAGIDFATSCLGNRYRVTRGNFNPAPIDTQNRELNLFVQDKWTIKNITLNLGVRWTRENIANPQQYKLLSDRTSTPLTFTDFCTGAPIVRPVGSLQNDAKCYDPLTNDFLVGPGVYAGRSYNFKAEFSPRVGISWDVLGNGKSKLYANFARLYERVPNDLAVRSFGNEFGVLSVNYNNPDLTGQISRGFAVGATPTRVQPGTRLPYKDDFTLGYQFEIRPRFLVDIKGNYRKQGRVLEDTQTSTVEAIDNYYYDYRIPRCTNCPAGITDFFPNAGHAAFGQYVLANVGDNAPTSFTDIGTGEKIPVSFGKPESKYRALSITLTKMPGEGQHVTLQATYRIARLTGNYEGLFRNDNGQSDPNITSLFDFPNSNLLRSQYFSGRLNTDTPHVLKVNVGYKDLWIKNLYGSVTFKWSSGQLRTPLLAHPMYQNPGEVPGIKPQYYLFDLFRGDGIADTAMLVDYTAVNRGYSGRNPDEANWDVKFGYIWNLGRSNLDFSVLINNLFNDRHFSAKDENIESQTGDLNPSYGLPVSSKAPRSVRLGLKWSF